MPTWPSETSATSSWNPRRWPSCPDCPRSGAPWAIDDVDPLGEPAQGAGPLDEGILILLAFSMLLHLVRAGLAHVDVRAPGPMVDREFLRSVPPRPAHDRRLRQERLRWGRWGRWGLTEIRGDAHRGQPPRGCAERPAGVGPGPGRAGAGRRAQSCGGRTVSALVTRVGVASPDGERGGRGKGSWRLPAWSGWCGSWSGRARCWLSMGFLQTVSWTVWQKRYGGHQRLHRRRGESAARGRRHRPAQVRRGHRDEAFHTGLEPYDAGATQARLGANRQQRQGQSVERMGRLSDLDRANRLNGAR